MNLVSCSDHRNYLPLDVSENEQFQFVNLCNNLEALFERFIVVAMVSDLMVTYWQHQELSLEWRLFWWVLPIQCRLRIMINAQKKHSTI